MVVVMETTTVESPQLNLLNSTCLSGSCPTFGKIAPVETDCIHTTSETVFRSSGSGRSDSGGGHGDRNNNSIACVSGSCPTFGVIALVELDCFHTTSKTVFRRSGKWQKCWQRCVVVVIETTITIQSLQLILLNITVFQGHV